MSTKNPSEKLEHMTSMFFDKENKIWNISGFNSECIMEIDFKIVKNGKYKIIIDDFQKITQRKYRELLKKFREGKTLNIALRICDEIWGGNYTAEIESLDKKISHRLYNPEVKKHFYTTASRV